MTQADEILSRWYAGEVGGVALFERLALGADSSRASRWLTLAEVEKSMAAQLGAALAARGSPLPPVTHMAARSRKRTDALAGKDWAALMAWLHDIATNALQGMRTDAARLPEQLRGIGDLVVRHEEALVAFAAFELSGDEKRSCESIDSFLSRL